MKVLILGLVFCTRLAQVEVANAGRVTSFTPADRRCVRRQNLVSMNPTWRKGRKIIRNCAGTKGRRLGLIRNTGGISRSDAGASFLDMPELRTAQVNRSSCSVALCCNHRT